MVDNQKVKIFFLVNHPVTILYFRKELVSTLIHFGYLVGILTPYDDKFGELELLGARIFQTPMNRKGTNPFQDFFLFLKYLHLLKKEKPDIVLSYTIKPNIFGGLACRVLGIAQIANVTGLGDAVENPGFIKKVVLFLSKIAYKNISTVFFQNSHDKELYEQLSLVKMDQTKLLPGSGVNLRKHSYIKYPEEDDAVRLLFIGRIMTDKGIMELLEAIQRVHAKRLFVTCDIVGFFEDYTFKTAVEAFSSLGAGKYLGVSDDVHALMSNYHAVVLPSYHEGMSNVLLEAAATGLPVLASNIPGCRETFDEGISGFGFEPRSVDSLVQAIERFVDLPHEQKAAMGLAGRKKMEREFDRQIVVDAYMREIENILEENDKKDKKK